jgi:hypothetical protein
MCLDNPQHNPSEYDFAAERSFERKPVSTPQIPARENVSVSEYVHRVLVPMSRLAHDWELHSAVFLSRGEERTMVREPAQAVPSAVAKRLGSLRILIVPYVACADEGDLISFSKPKGETHSSVWLETDERIFLVIPCRESDAHDTGFELLASIAELLRPRLSDEEAGNYAQLLEEELRLDIQGEIDEDAAAAKQLFVKGRRHHRRSRSPFARYRDISFVSTMAEYMHGLWHDVQIRTGPEHLPLAQLRRRLDFLAGIFPPNAGYQVFSEDLEREESNPE